MWLIRSTRFVVIPLIIAMGYNHREVLQSNENVKSLYNVVATSTADLFKGNQK